MTTFETVIAVLGGLNAAGLFAAAGAAWRWIMRTERRLQRLEHAVWPDSIHPTR